MKKMKKLVIWVAAVVATVAAADVAFGWLSGRYMAGRTLPGDYEMADHVLRHFDDDVAVLGSSVALNSINTRTVADSLGLTAFNGGANGQSFPFYLTMLKAMVQQKAPRSVLLGIIPSNLTDSGIGSRYNFLAPYYGTGLADIDSRMQEAGPAEKLLLKSNLYRLNRIWFRILLYNFASAGIKGENGFIAKGIPAAFPERFRPDELPGMSPERRKEFEEFAGICRDNGIGLTVMMTPRCVADGDTAERRVIEEARAICRRYGFRLYDDTSLGPFRTDSTLFYDCNHINIDGSRIYTDTIINRMKRQ